MNIFMSVPADTPPHIEELARRIVRTTTDYNKEGHDNVEDCVIACLSVAFAYLAAVKDDTDRNTIIGSLSQLATEAVALNRQRDPNAFVLDTTVQ